MNNLIFKQIFDDEEKENIINNIKHKDWLEDENLSRISITGKESDIEKYLDHLKCNFMIAILKLPLEIQLTKGADLLKKLTSISHLDTELITLIDQRNNNIVTLFGVAKMQVVPFGFSFTKEMPSPVENSFKEKILRIFPMMKGNNRAGNGYQNRIILTDSYSYLNWSHKLRKWSNKFCNNPTLSSEIEEALALINGQFRNHANTVLYKHEG